MKNADTLDSQVNTKIWQLEVLSHPQIMKLNIMKICQACSYTLQLPAVNTGWSPTPRQWEFSFGFHLPSLFSVPVHFQHDERN